MWMMSLWMVVACRQEPSIDDLLLHAAVVRQSGESTDGQYTFSAPMTYDKQDPPAPLTMAMCNKTGVCLTGSVVLAEDLGVTPAEALQLHAAANAKATARQPVPSDDPATAIVEGRAAIGIDVRTLFRTHRVDDHVFFLSASGPTDAVQNPIIDLDFDQLKGSLRPHPVGPVYAALAKTLETTRVETVGTHTLRVPDAFTRDSDGLYIHGTWDLSMLVDQESAKASADRFAFFTALGPGEEAPPVQVKRGEREVTRRRFEAVVGMRKIVVVQETTALPEGVLALTVLTRPSLEAVMLGVLERTWTTVEAR